MSWLPAAPASGSVAVGALLFVLVDLPSQGPLLEGRVPAESVPSPGLIALTANSPPPAHFEVRIRESLSSLKRAPAMTFNSAVISQVPSRNAERDCTKPRRYSASKVGIASI